MNQRSHRSWAITILSLFVSFGLMVYLMTKLDLSRLAQLVRQADVTWLLVASFLAALTPFCGTCRWLGVLRAQGHVTIPPGMAWRAVMFAHVLNTFLPSKAGDIAKAVYLRNHGGISTGFGTVILERLADFWTLGALGILGGLISGTNWGVFAGGTLIVLTICVYTFIAVWPANEGLMPLSWRQTFVEWRLVFRNWQSNPLAVCITLAGSFANWFLAGLIVCALAASLGSAVTWGYLTAVFPLAILAGLMPFTISGIGTRDTAFIVLLSGHLTMEGAALVGIGYTVLTYWFVAILGLPWLIKDFLNFLRDRKALLMA